MERIDSITYRKGNGSLIRSIEYGYDAAGMITNKTIAGGVDAMTLSYGYDSIDRLTSETRTGSAPSVVNYSYDLAGNRLACLCGELSLLAAQTNPGELMEAHRKLERKPA